jgi:flagellar basal-body rod modification protein FlgD
MTTVTPTTSAGLLSSTATTAGATGSAATAASSATTTQDSFLKLMVAQLNNQDPMNPMDNTAMTSEMAQINTVGGIGQLNTTMTSMLSQLSSMQAMQGAALTGHTVLASGNTLTVQKDGFSGSFSLPANADKVGVDVVTAGGQVIDHIELGPQASGQHNFNWTNATYGTGLAAPNFRISATGAGQALTATPLMQSTVDSVSTVNGALQLNLQGIGNVPYSSVVSIM